MKRIVACILTMLLLAAMLFSAAAEENLYDKLIPMMDQAAAQTVTDRSGYVGVRPMAAEMSPDGDAVVVLGDLYCAQAQLDQLTPEQYGEVEWLDRRVVAQFALDPATGAWSLNAFRQDAELLMEDAVQSYFRETMRTYVNETLGFSVQYPAVFDSVQEQPNGMRAVLSSGQAFCLAERSANSERHNLAGMVAIEERARPFAKVTLNEAAGSYRSMWSEAGMTTADVYAVTDSWIYHVQLCWQDDLSEDFILYSDYMMNSLSVDEFGIG